jgi:CHAT domain-containing protein
MALLLLLAASLEVAAQQDLSREAQKLQSQAYDLIEAGRYREAVPFAERALAIRERLVGPDHPETAVALDNLAEIHRAAEAYSKAEPLHRRALAIRESVLGPEHRDTASSLNRLGLLYSDTGAYAQALQFYQRAMTIGEKVFGPEHPSIATMLGNLAEVYRVTGAYDTAEPLYRRSLAIQEKILGTEHASTALTINNLALFYQETGKYALAEPLQLKALGIFERTRGYDHPDVALALNNLAWLYFAVGAYEKSEPLYRRALTIEEKTAGPESAAAARTRGNLATLYSATGAHQLAETLARGALQAREKVLGPGHPATATALNNLAYLYYTAGAHAQAEPLYRRAVAIQEKALGREHPELAGTLNNLALFYYVTGQYRKAEPIARRALRIAEKRLGDDHPYTALLLSNLASIDMARGKRQAEALYQRALGIHEGVFRFKHNDVIPILSSLATLYAGRGASERALPLYEQAQSIGESNVLRLLLSGSESRKLQYVQQMAQQVHQNVSISLTYAEVRSQVLGSTSVLQYKGRVLDAMSDSIARLRRSLVPEDQELLDELAGVARELSRLMYANTADISAAPQRVDFETLLQRQETLQGQLAKRSAASRQVAPVTLQAVRESLPADAVLVEWFRVQPTPVAGKAFVRGNAPRYVAYVLERTRDPVAIDVGEAEPIEALIARFRLALADPGTAGRGAARRDSQRLDVRQVAMELFGKLVRPLMRHLAGHERLLFSPDGPLNLVPFAALLNDDGEYLAQRFEISYLTSGRDLLRMGSGSPARGAPAVLAAPAYGPSSATQLPVRSAVQSARSAALDRTGLVFNPLPATEVEAKGLQRLLNLDGARVLTGERATEAQLRALQGPRILHLATHGFFLADQPQPVSLGPAIEPREKLAPVGENPLLRSGLALAGANQRSSGELDDGILTAAEVAQLDLVGTQLVVLSACESALGTVDAGEGVYGLRRALVLAGAESQLVSLWKVDDVATQELMTQYYERLLEGEGRAAALRSVQRAMLADPERQHPYYWAAFIPIGDWTPLRQ